MRAVRSAGEMGLAPEVMGFSPVTRLAPSPARAEVAAKAAVVAVIIPSAARLVSRPPVPRLHPAGSALQLVRKRAPIRPHIARRGVHSHAAIQAILNTMIAPEPAVGLAKLPTQRGQRRARRIRHTGLEP
jgi:hypothetical protein